MRPSTNRAPRTAVATPRPRVRPRRGRRARERHGARRRRWRRRRGDPPTAHQRFVCDAVSCMARLARMGGRCEQSRSRQTRLTFLLRVTRFFVVYVAFSACVVPPFCVRLASRPPPAHSHRAKVKNLVARPPEHGEASDAIRGGSPRTPRPGEWPAWFSFWFSGRWRAVQAGGGRFFLNGRAELRINPPAPYSPGNGTVFFVITSSPGAIYGGSCGIALNSTTQRHPPRLGLVSGSRGPTQIHIRGLCHWAGEPAGHLGA